VWLCLALVGTGTASPGRGISMTRLFRRLAKDDKGATAIEYGLIAALIAVVLITALGTLGTNMSNQFNALSTKIANPSR
jgi:pilus assembly protein Flp/PilA